MIEVKNLCAYYGKNCVFKNVSFKIEDGSFVALCGKNGAGKSTLLSLIDGIIPEGLSIDGEIFIDGKNIFSLKRKEIAKRISFLVQNEKPVWNMTVKQFVQTGLYSFESMSKMQIDSLVNKALEKFGLSSFSDKLIFNISGGEFQKCRLARSFIQSSDVLLFDEPSENLDLPFQSQLMTILKNFAKEDSKKIVIFSIHDLNVASTFCEDFILFSKNDVVVNSREKIFTKEVLEKAYDSKVKIFVHPVLDVLQVLFL